jgi:hypothetical protein
MLCSVTSVFSRPPPPPPSDRRILIQLLITRAMIIVRRSHAHSSMLNTPRTLAHNQPRTHQLAHQRHHQLTAHTHPPPTHTHINTTPQSSAQPWHRRWIHVHRQHDRCQRLVTTNFMAGSLQLDLSWSGPLSTLVAPTGMDGSSARTITLPNNPLTTLTRMACWLSRSLASCSSSLSSSLSLCSRSERAHPRAL